MIQHKNPKQMSDANFEIFCEKMDSKFDVLKSRLMWISGIILVAFIGVLVSYGATKNQVEKDTANIHFIARDYMPFWYGDNMIKLMNLHTEKVVATLNGNDKEVEKINKEFEETMKIIQDNFIKMRGGMTQITRSVKSETR